MAPCLEQGDEVLHDHRALFAGGRLERPVEAAADRLGHVVLQPREPHAQAVALVVGADGPARRTGLELPARGEIGMRGQGREAKHRFLELGGALVPRAARPELKREPVAHLGGPGAQDERAPQRCLGGRAGPHGGSERLVAFEVRRGRVEGAEDERPRARAVTGLRKQKVRLCEAVAG